MNMQITDHPVATGCACAECGKQFEPRKSGGHPQKFCSPECRLAFHAKDTSEQRRQHFTLPTVPPATPLAEPEPDAPSSREFDWDDAADDIVQHKVQALAVYRNRNGNVVLRAKADWPHDDEDQWIVVAHSNLDALIKKLEDLR